MYASSASPESRFARPQTPNRAPELPLAETESDRQARVEQTIAVEGEQRKHIEQDLSESVFALEQFFSGGGQVLIDVFGGDTVMRTIRTMANDRQEREPDMYKLICKLQPSKSERASLYSQMTHHADRLVRNAEQEDRPAAESSTEARTRERIIGRSHLQSIELTAASSQQADTLMGASPEDTYQLKQVLQPLLRICAEHPSLIDIIARAKGDLLKAIASQDEYRGMLQSARVQRMNALLDEIQREVDVIAETERTTVRETIKPVSAAFEAFSESLQRAPNGADIVRAANEAVRQQLAQIKQLAHVQAGVRSRPWKALQERAQAVSY